MHPRTAPSTLATTVFVVAVLAHLAIAIPLLSIGLVVPLYAFPAFWGLWAAALFALIRMRGSRPLLTPVIPVVTAAVLVGLLSLGGWLLGWTP